MRISVLETGQWELLKSNGQKITLDSDDLEFLRVFMVLRYSGLNDLTYGDG